MLQSVIDIIDEKEEKKYLLLYYAVEQGKEIKSFEFLTGRDNLYNYVKEAMLKYELDPHESTVMLLRDDGSSTKANTVFSILHYFKLEGFYPDDDFDIDEYAEYVSEDEEQ